MLLLPPLISLLVVFHFLLMILSDSSFSFNEVPVDTVFKLLSSLEFQKSTGPDRLSARYLKEIAVEIAVPLTDSPI